MHAKLIQKTKKPSQVCLEKVAKKVANRTSHRYNHLPLLPSGPGGVQQELVVPICRAKGNKIVDPVKSLNLSNYLY